MKQETIDRVREALKNYKFRSSSAGSVVSASGKLIQTAKTYGDKLLMELINGYKERISSEAMEKGTACEPEARAMIYRLFFPGMYIPDSQRVVESDYFRGHIDMEPNGIIIDAKNAQNAKTFMASDLTHDNEWQMKTYLHGNGTKRGYVIYCLNDLPEELLNKKIALLWKYGGYESAEDPKFLKEKENLIRSETYPELADEDRVKVFPVELTDADVEKMETCAAQLRQYMIDSFEEMVARAILNKAKKL